ncbi:MAG: hypothetical protein COB12_08530 [Flavobacterium sp.]|nr:MAG: hypothetical protein COB12_08530 [Flavobacterium sp.]
MKKIKLLFLSLVISIGIFSSCTDNNDIDNLPDVQQSDSVQNVIAELRTMYNEDGSVNPNEQPTGDLIFDFCFEFVYPIELIYNDGSTVTVNSNEELITVIIGANNDLYVVGIVFPFDVEVYNSETNQIEIVTINNEADFIVLLESCDYNEPPCDCDNEFDPVCVEVGTPNGGTMVVTYQNECYALCDGFTPNDFVDCENGNDCDCDDEYEPVCVEVAGAIIQFDNYCLAECAGYTQQDIVDCEDDCEIEELHVTLGDCNADGTYSITINFDYTGAQENFDVYVRDGVLIGNYPVASLPLTITDFELSGYDEDYIKVCFEGTNGDDCCEEEEWDAPDCNGNGGDCSISELEVEIGECNPSGTYILTIDFDYENVEGQQYFDLFVRNDQFIGYYLLSELPVTIPNFELSGYDDDYIKVCINDIEGCCQEIEWDAPDCNGNVLCYEYVFPVSLTLNGTAVTVNSNEDVDYYLDLGYQLLYPIDIIYNNETITVQQGILEGAYGERCDD